MENTTTLVLDSLSKLHQGVGPIQEVLMEGGSADFFSTVRDLMHQPGLAVQMLDLETKVANLGVVVNQALQDVLS